MMTINITVIGADFIEISYDEPDSAHLLVYDGQLSEISFLHQRMHNAIPKTTFERMMNLLMK